MAAQQADDGQRRLSGRVAIVTGAGRGLGRAYALALARAGAAVIVNDVGASLAGETTATQPARDVVEEIVRAGGQAVASEADVADWDGAEELLGTAIEMFGKLDVLVNNAGVLRDRTLVNMSAEEWDAVIRVHLRGTFAPLHFAAQHWRERAKAGEQLQARAINTTSSAGLFAFPGQGNYSAAKAGIAALSIVAAKELGRYGVTVNAIAPAALTRMTESLPVTQDWTLDRQGPDQAAQLIVWLASTASAAVSGEVFGIGRGRLYLAQGWREAEVGEQEGGWSASELELLVPKLIAARDAEGHADD